MSVAAETYIVISLMFAVFAAVAAVGTSIVLGAGFERLRAGFEVVKGQTAFFADAIYKLDQRTETLGEQTAHLKEAVSGMSDKVERVDKQTGFFADAIQSLENRMPVESLVKEGVPARDRDPAMAPSVMPAISEVFGRAAAPSIPGNDDVLSSLRLLAATGKPDTVPQQQLAQIPLEAGVPKGLPHMLAQYWRNEDRPETGAMYH